jgi:LysR family transcriptional regulator for metE and metH
MLTLQHLYIIEKVISEGSLTKASEKLNLSQSALSHQIRELEAVAGFKIFDRIGKKLVINEAGKRIVAGAAQILPIVRQLEAELQEIKAGKFETIRISTECYTCYHWLPKLLKEFNNNFPNVNVQIVAEATRRPMCYLEAGQLELAIVSAESANPKFTYQPLFSDELVLVTSSDHPLATRNEPIEKADLATETLIVYQIGTKDDYINQDFVSSISAKKIMEIPLTEAIIEMVKFGIGVTIMTNWAARQYENVPGLSRLNFSNGAGSRNWYACTRSHPSESLTSLVQEIKSALS